MVRAGLRSFTGWIARLLVLMTATLLAFAGASEPHVAARVRIPPHAEIPDDKLTGSEIYERVLDNRFDTYIQETTLTSADRGGNAQTTRLKMWFESLRDADRKPLDGITLSKTLVRYLAPFDLRHSGYLVINKLDFPNDQFVYLNSQRLVRRVNLRGETVFGTDFSFEDVIPHELEDSTYSRLPDEQIEGRPVFVIEAVPKPIAKSEYSKIRAYVEKDRSLVLRARYWDEREIIIKEMTAHLGAIELIQRVWVPRRITMRHLKLDSYTTLNVDEIDPNIELTRTHFDLRRLEGH
ncbi:MAG: outer membrane lipoprotein-sorting protein [Deltaproteobacteria bacterium]|nr:outer membrane lipoprotein-sorting protein [Deltaproteobacteria bacterium]MBW2417514.1 outer membrane lipoprotein-sorting protein [Deltaproteobacteria bacterium]